MLLAIVMALIALASPVAAQPWSQGVTDAMRADAQKRLEEGNALFLSKRFKEALETYRLAVAAWDHPAIRFNMVRVLIQLERPIEAFDELTKALRYGKEPFDEAIYNEALNYEKLLATQIAEIEVSCTQPGAKITLDGQTLMTCPGKETRRIAPGQHGVVATKDGFLTKQLDVVVVGGKRETVELELVPLAQAARVVHRWPEWIPWVVFGSGLAVASAGGLIQYSASDLMDDYDRTIARDCAVMGCDLSDPRYAELVDQRQRAQMRNKIAIGVIGVGAAGAIAGGVMLVMNRGRTVYDNSAERRGPEAARLDFVPHAGGGVVSVSGGF
jgi:tetratricopeptide (TPR) repeat protein